MKAPAIQFYVKDWLSDPQLKMASFSTKGIWIDMICFMWSAPEPGKITGTGSDIAKLLGATNTEIQTFLSDAEKLGFCDVTRPSRDSNALVTIINRRINRNWKDKESNRLRQQRFRGYDDRSIDSNANVQKDTHDRGIVGVIEGSISNNKDKYLDAVFLTASDYQKLISRYGQVLTDQAIFVLNNYIMGKQKDPYKSHYHTLLGWPMERAREKTGGSNAGIRTSRSDPSDKNLQSRTDAECDAITARWYAAKKAAGSDPGGNAGNDDAPNFSGVSSG
jgi:hypothetical protein